ncbi:MAG: MFS transporter [Anaerolineaceae bacterium]|nr:MFS transporter [Anaerolineaceae bacterium]
MTDVKEAETQDYKLYPYRWVVLGVFMLMVFAIQPLWISYSPIIAKASEFYGVDYLRIGWFSMLFMLVFLPFSLPASWAIDTWGFKKSVSLGAVLLGVFGLLRGLIGHTYPLALACTLGIALAQPLLLNSWVKLPMLWFGVKERASVIGMILMANTLGTILGSLLTPYLLDTMGMSIPAVQTAYGAFAAFSSLLFLVFAKEKPETPPAPAHEQVRTNFFDGTKLAFKNPVFLLFLFTIFAGMGVFNGVTTWVGAIVGPRGFSAQQAGLLISLMLLAGVFGSQTLPRFSDKEGKRQKYIFIGYLFSIIGIAGITFARQSWLLYGSAALLGFFLIGSNPVALQYGAEVAKPTPEGTTAGIIQLVGQASVVFVYLMEALKGKDGSFTSALLLAIGLMTVSLFIITRLKDPSKASSADELD